MEPNFTLDLDRCNVAKIHADDIAESRRLGHGNAISQHVHDIGYGPEWYGLPRKATQADLLTHCETLVRSSNEACIKRVNGALREAQGLNVPSAVAIRPSWVEGRIIGTRPNVSRLLSGHPDAWGRFERQARQKDGTKIVRLYVDLVGHGGLGADELAWAPVAGIVTANILEAAGYRCEIWGIATTNNYNVYTSVRVLLKRAESDLDIVSLSRISDPAFMRAVVYPCLRAYAGNTQRGYGPCSSPNVAGYESDPDKCIVLQAAYSASKAAARIEAALANFQKEE